MKTSNDTQLLNVLVSPLEAMIINLIPVPAHPATTFDDDAFRSRRTLGLAGARGEGGVHRGGANVHAKTD